LGVSAALPSTKPLVYKGSKSTVKARSKRKWIIERKIEIKPSELPLYQKFLTKKKC